MYTSLSRAVRRTEDSTVRRTLAVAITVHMAAAVLAVASADSAPRADFHLASDGSSATPDLAAPPPAEPAEVSPPVIDAPPAPLPTNLAPEPAEPPTTAAPEPTGAMPREEREPDGATASEGWRERGRVAISRVTYDWSWLAKLGWTVELHPSRPGHLGITQVSDKRIDLYVRTGRATELVAVDFAHELGHAVDFELNRHGYERRRKFAELRGYDATSWYVGCDGCSDYASPAGDWAEVFAYWQLGDVDWRSEMASRPSPHDLALLSPLFTP